MKALAGILLVLLGCAGASARAQGLPEVLAENFYPPDLLRMAYPALNLSEEQKAELQAADEKVSEQQVRIKKALTQETARLAAMVKAEQLDNDAVMVQADRVMKLEQESNRAALALLLKIRESLTPEQQAKLRAFKAQSAAFQTKVRQAMELAQKWKQEGRDLSQFEQARRQFETRMRDGDFQAAEALLNQALQRLQAPAPEPKK